MRHRSHIIFGCLVTISACSATSGNQARQTYYSNESEAALATCVSQDWSAAFPRFFPSVENGKAKVFRTYNGIAVSIAPDGDRRKVEVRSDNPLSSEMSDYLQKCAAGSFNR